MCIATVIPPSNFSAAWYVEALGIMQGQKAPSPSPPPPADDQLDLDALLASVFASIPDREALPQATLTPVTAPSYACETLPDFAQAADAGPSTLPSLPTLPPLPTLPWDLGLDLGLSLPTPPLATSSTSSATPALPTPAGYDSREAKWAAVLARDPAADAAFVYCVLTTKIFCRPTCPSRRPLATNVDFAANPAEAMGMGFRACRRCLPDCIASASETRQVLAVEQARTILHDCIDNKTPVPNLAALSAQVGMSKFHFQRTFKRLVGESPDTYARGLRARRPRSPRSPR
ncbi:hypothetical protein Q8F55_001722 [Vanrija albida]|uniref:HTH araC/xylS-type domain-containing protein n=1 Tax=Vanrija albida TaxID=181172 RepID=A0ABR3Q807_9TREE